MGENDTIGDAWTGGESAGAKDQRALVVVYRDGIQVVPLRAGQPVTIGRTDPADIRVGSRRLSRVHAQFTLEGDTVEVEDLGSTNGTYLNGRQVKRALVGPQDEVTVGSAVITVHGLGALPGGLQGIERRDRFLAMAEREVERSRTFGRSVAVLLVRAFGGRGMLARWVPRVQGAVRKIDVVGLASPHAIDIMLIEADIAEARALAMQLVHDRAEGEPPLVVGLACYPSHGDSGRALLDAASEAASAASLVDPVVVHQRSLGDSGLVDPEEGPVVRNPRMVEVWRTLDRVASANISVLILGETGVGKEILARGIHDRSPRQEAPWRCINCGAIPDSLVESVLFGHEKGAFTGADEQRAGVFEEADGGTVLLDEVGELSLQAQVALLRVLDKGHVQRVGGSREIPVDIRVLAATHRDLEDMCRSGAFRWDLFYRLNTMTLSVPPLRERVEDIRPMVRRFIQDANLANRRNIVGVTPEALHRLETWSWPGNVRELRNAIERAVVVASGDYLTVDDLPPTLRVSDSGEPVGEPEELLVDDQTDTSALEGETPEVEPLKDAVAALERTLICGALAACDGNQTRAADLLDIPRRTLVYKLKRYEIGEGWQGARPLRQRFDEQGRRLSFALRVQTFEIACIQHALRLTGGDRIATAEQLDIQKRTLDRKLDQFGLDSLPPPE